MRLPILFTMLCASSSFADQQMLAGNTSEVGYNPLGHAPIGVMGDHMHSAGEWMVSYRYMSMTMEDSLQGRDEISPAEIIQTPNRFFGQAMQPPMLRVVPMEMQTQMHMLGLMYAPSDQLTLMAMVNYVDKEMEHLTFNMMGEPIGEFTTRASGLGDTKVAGLWRLHDDEVHHLHLNLGLSLPTGNIDEEDVVLAPTGMMPQLRLPYGMQLGSGSYELMPGLTYTGTKGALGWGSQLSASVPLADNDEDYKFGSETEITGWASYRLLSWMSGSLRLSYQHREGIEGSDEQIVAPVQTADPDNYGGDWVNLGIGLNLVGQGHALGGHRLAVEYELPLMQDVNGIQMEMKSMLTLGYQYAF